MIGVKNVVDPRKGRTLVADRNFEYHGVIFEEEPIVSCQFPYNQDYKYLACDNCMAPLETAHENVRRLAQQPDIVLPDVQPDDFVKPWEHVQCPTCRVTYCGTECQQKALAYYHRSLCAEPGTAEATAIEKLRQKWQDVHYPPEESTIMLVLRIFAIIQQAQDKNSVIESFQNFTLAGSEEAETRWINHEGAKNELHKLLIRCVKILKLDIPANLLTLKGFGKILSMMALNSQGIATCSFAHWIALHDAHSTVNNVEVDTFIDATYRRLEETVGMQFLNNEGCGLYPVQSKMSHSCDPNTEIIFPHANHILGVRALRDIHQGEELTISYIDECELTGGRHSRQKLIKEKHLFDCLCHKCESQLDQPEETSESDMDDEDFENDMNFMN